jgi:hypothetical protein
MQKAHTAYFSLSALSCRAKALTRLSRSYCDPVQALNCFDRCHASTQASIACADASTQARINSEDASTQAGFHVSDVTVLEKDRPKPAVLLLYFES